MKKLLRIIETEDQEKNQVTIVTSCFDLTAKEIGDLYRYRWKIETFFKWIKQHLKLKIFYGKGQNAVYNQIWITLITYFLEVLLQLKVGYTGSLLEVRSSLKNNLFKGFNAFSRSLFRQLTRWSTGRRKLDWEAEFRIIGLQFLEGEVSHFDDLIYDLVFIEYKKFRKKWIRAIFSSTMSFLFQTKNK